MKFMSWTTAPMSSVRDQVQRLVGAVTTIDGQAVQLEQHLQGGATAG